MHQIQNVSDCSYLIYYLFTLYARDDLRKVNNNCIECNIWFQSPSGQYTIYRYCPREKSFSGWQFWMSTS